MIQSAFILYWSYSHLIAFALLLLIISYRVWSAHTPLRNINGHVDLLKPITSKLNAFELTIAALGVGHCLFYLCLPYYADYGEPVMALLASNAANGAPIYADWKAGHSVVGSNYGPYIFITQMPVVMWLPSIYASKLTGIIFALLGLALFYKTVKRYDTLKNEAVALTALMVALLAFELHYWFWNRPDSLLIAMVAGAVFTVDRTKPTTSLIVLGLLAGIAINLKLFAAVYFVPLGLVCLIDSFKNLPRFLIALALGLALFVVALILPFTLSTIDAKPYLNNIFMMPHQGFDPPAVIESLFYGAGILALPFLRWRNSGFEREGRLLFLSLCVCVLLIAIVSGKPGGGTPYMMPFVPLALYVAALMPSRVNPLVQKAMLDTRHAVFAAMLLGSAPIWAYSWYQMARRLPTISAEAQKPREIRAIFAAYPHAEMGHNNGVKPEWDEFYRVERAFMGQTIRFDYVNYGDQRAAGVSSHILLPLIEKCSVPEWVFPRGGERFKGTAYGHDLLEADTLQRFYANYELAKTYTYYEVWRCRVK